MTTAPDDARAAVEPYLHEHIPISRAMGIAVVHAECSRIGLSGRLTTSGPAL